MKVRLTDAHSLDKGEDPVAGFGHAAGHAAGYAEGFNAALVEFPRRLSNAPHKEVILDELLVVLSETRLKWGTR